MQQIKSSHATINVFELQALPSVNSLVKFVIINSSCTVLITPVNIHFIAQYLYMHM